MMNTSVGGHYSAECAVEFALLLSLGAGFRSVTVAGRAIRCSCAQTAAWPLLADPAGEAQGARPWKGPLVARTALCDNVFGIDYPSQAQGWPGLASYVARGRQAQLDLSAYVDAGGGGEMPSLRQRCDIVGGGDAGVHSAFGGEVFHSGPGVGFGCVQEAGAGEPVGQVAGSPPQVGDGVGRRAEIVEGALPVECVLPWGLEFLADVAEDGEQVAARGGEADAGPGQGGECSEVDVGGAGGLCRFDESLAEGGVRVDPVGVGRGGEELAGYGEYVGALVRQGAQDVGGGDGTVRLGRGRDLPVVQGRFEPVVEGGRSTEGGDGAEPVQASDGDVGVGDGVQDAFGVLGDGQWPVGVGVGAAADGVAGGDQADGQDVPGGGRGLAGLVQDGLSGLVGAVEQVGQSPEGDTEPGHRMGVGGVGRGQVRAGVQVAGADGDGVARS